MESVTGWWWRCRVWAPGHQDHNICQETVLGWFTFYTLQPRKAAIISDILHTHPYRTTIWKSRNLDADQFYGHDFVINPEFWLNFGPAPRSSRGLHNYYSGEKTSHNLPCASQYSPSTQWQGRFWSPLSHGHHYMLYVPIGVFSWGNIKLVRYLMI